MHHNVTYSILIAITQRSFHSKKITLKVLAKEKGLLSAYRLISGEISLQKKGKHEYTQKTIPF